MKLREYIRWFENILTICVFSILTIFPAIEIFTRVLGRPGIPASPILVQHMTLWIGFIGAVLATRQNKLLSLTRVPLFSSDKVFNNGRWIAKNISFVIIGALFWGSITLVMVEYDYPIQISPGVYRWFIQLIMPAGFLLIAFQIFLKSSTDNLYRLLMLIISALFGFIMKWSKLFPHLENTYYKKLGTLRSMYHDGISGIIVQLTLLLVV